MEHDELIRIGLGVIGLAQVLWLALFTMLWNQNRELVKDGHAMRKDLHDHSVDHHAHGNGMPRPEVEARIESVSLQVGAITTQAGKWFDENRLDHQKINERLDDVLAAIARIKP